mmetsp:Transcript_6371/g.18052  ORF Transcript_6371/g.18052 Transcript_6371/m.18052 type:complete len:204 (+) Transcript_6371:61-672(+)
MDLFEDDDENFDKIKFAVVCASNMNRSMEAHSCLRKRGMCVKSYGTSTVVKLPGPSATKPNVYEFGTPYETIYQELKAKDMDLYKQNGVLSMLERNIHIKTAPERFQNQNEEFDIILAFEDRVYEAIIEDLSTKGSKTFKLVHVVNMPIKDTHEEALIGGAQCLQLCQALDEKGQDWEASFASVAQEFTARTGRKLNYSPMFY